MALGQVVSAQGLLQTIEQEAQDAYSGITATRTIGTVEVWVGIAGIVALLYVLNKGR